MDSLRSTSQGAPDHVRRRRRPAVSCTLCRKRKVRCNRETPCNNCLRSKTAICVYEAETHTLSRDKAASKLANRHPPSSTSATTPSTPSTQSTTHEVESLKGRISELETQLPKLTPVSPSRPATDIFGCNVPSTNAGIGVSPNPAFDGSYYVEQGSKFFGEGQALPRGITHKDRMFGQSHWVNGVTWIQDIIEILEPKLHNESSDAVSKLARAKALSRIIKKQRTPPWPTAPTVDMPSKEVADELVDIYLRTLEPVYRILHIPSFRSDYEALWTSQNEPNEGYMVQLKLVLAIGASMRDDTFSLRTSASRWVMEGITYASAPALKSKFGIQFLQINLLVLIAREAVDVASEMTWISAGSLLRIAIQMGLHRDPSRLPKRSIFLAEMRRRLWNTIIELNLQSSLTSGGPPLFSMEDFDTQPPKNLDDEQLSTDNPVACPEETYTQCSIAIALRTTLPLRLAVVKQLNDLYSRTSYDQTLRLHSELKDAYKHVYRALQRWNRDNDAPSSSRFEIRMVDFIMHRYISSLHMPFFGPRFHDSAYAFSRKVVVESSLKIWCTAYPSSSLIAAHRTGAPSADPNNDYLKRLVICGSGFFRTVVFQATCTIGTELKMQLQEEESLGLGPVPLRLDLLSVLDDAKTWYLQCVEAGETGIKGYLLISLLSAQINALMRSVVRNELSDLFVKTVEEAEDTCLPILEMMVSHGQTEETAPYDLSALDLTPATLNNWDFMLDVEPTSWIFDDGAAQAMAYF
ncbi:hypothetical protein EJ04DRAFT_520928 [Polyplosphaeria fusca]|uniref:Zn(2)-C6 fungal-type domain-containing protein n=1 Tax=Polyplosphaeria fusca TaxID=682080 RepID=A0A9P4V5N2_9PLEO|nr:hypothetical protein EJ04DRAFT_520928 [Polyplosphaeria fusca]